VPEPLTEVLDEAAFDELFDSTGSDPEFLSELIDSYLADAPVQIEELRTAIAAGDAEAAVRPAHTLKSASASLAALGLAEHCRRLERSATAGSLDGAAEMVDSISAEFERVAEALERAKSRVAT
jgi:HPt (histidine-containing phosphotransfer) domain-containing protein